MNTQEAAKDRWREIYQAIGVPYSQKKHVECPLCLNKSFRTDDKSGNGEWICTCGAGNGIMMVQQHLEMSFVEAAQHIDKIIGFKFEREYKLENILPVSVNNTKSWVLDMWSKGVSLEGTIGEKYLQSRRIYHKMKGLRFVERMCLSKEESVYTPAIMSVMTTPEDLVRIHCTHLNEDGQKYNHKSNKKLINIWESDYITPNAAIKLFDHNGILGISEGIENSASAKALFDVPTWSLCNANLLEKFRAPKGVHTLYIFADNDVHGRGLAAAFQCGYYNLMNKNDVKVVFIRCPLIENDFNDILNGGDPRWFEKELSRKD